MRTKTLQLMLTALTALLLAGPGSAQNTGSFTVDGDPMDWSLLRFDEYADVVPDTNSTVDLLGYRFGAAGVYAGGDTLFTFLFQFVAPSFQGAEETTVEIFFDMSHSDSYGVAQGPWSDFRPDYVIGVTGSNGALTKEFYWRYTGSGVGQEGRSRHFRAGRGLLGPIPGGSPGLEAAEHPGHGPALLRGGVLQLMARRCGSRRAPVPGLCAGQSTNRPWMEGADTPLCC